MCRTSSGSSCSEWVVKPTRSAKRTLTILRSSLSSGGTGAAGGAAGGGAAPSTRVPQLVQNAMPGATASPQPAQRRSNGVPHWPQKREPGGLSKLHAEQVKGAAPGSPFELWPGSAEHTNPACGGGGDRDQRAGELEALVVLRDPEIHGDELGGGADRALGELGRGDRVGARRRLAALGHLDG